MASDKIAVICIGLGLLGGMIRMTLQDAGSLQPAPAAHDICSRAATSEADRRLLEQVRKGFGCPGQRA